jgi:hypothetical protein
MASGKKPGRSDLRSVAAEWNRIGREFSASQAAQLKLHYDGEALSDGEPADDPRPLALAKRVLREVRRLNAEGRWRDARELFDPAHEPFIPLLEKHGQELPFAVILGGDEFLVRQGRRGDMLRIIGDRIETLAGVGACAISRDRASLLLVREDGLTTSRGLGGDRIAHFPWPEETTRAAESVALSDDGRRVAFANENDGVWVGTARAKGVVWTRVHPDEATSSELKENSDDDDFDDEGGDDDSWYDDMAHCALSPDGRFVAYGSQSHGHFIDELASDGASRRWAMLGHHSEYPHNACFSDDGRYAALNSCHFYGGVTLGVALESVEAAATPPWEEDPRVAKLDDNLRVYASTWLPQDVIKVAPGAFALCGLGLLTCVTPDGKVVFGQMFGSSASAVDYCPKTRRMIVASCSGFLHVYDVDALEQPDRMVGFNARRELYRWVLWKDHEPFRW